MPIPGSKHGSSIEAVDIGDRFVDQDGRVDCSASRLFAPEHEGYEAGPKESRPRSSGRRSRTHVVTAIGRGQPENMR